MSDEPPIKSPYWRPAGRSRRHIYYVPANDLPGVLLFVLIGIGGCAAFGIGAWHLWRQADSRQDWLLVGIGTCLVWLAMRQGWRLWKDGLAGR
jgi:hypothetical protein